MRSTTFGLALLFASGLLASNASAGSFGRSGGGAFGHPGSFGRFGVFAEQPESSRARANYEPIRNRQRSILLRRRADSRNQWQENILDLLQRAATLATLLI